MLEIMSVIDFVMMDVINIVFLRMLFNFIWLLFDFVNVVMLVKMFGVLLFKGRSEILVIVGGRCSSLDNFFNEE